MHLTVAHDFLPKSSSIHTSLLMDHFGIGFETGRHTIAEDFHLPLQRGQLVCFTGPSGSGKSSLLRAVAARISNVLDVDRLVLPSRPLIDILTAPLVPEGDTPRTFACPLAFSQALQVLTSCGLGEPRLLLRTPQELSDGQRYRFRLALALAYKPDWIVADEFTATLDRTLARIVAFNLHRLNQHTGTGFLLATTHDDILSDLQPHLHIACDLAGAITLHSSDSLAPSAGGHSASGSSRRLKKKNSPSPGNSLSRPDRSAIGRISLGGITAAATSASSAS